MTDKRYGVSWGTVKSVDEDEGTVDAIMSTEAVDRDGDIIRVAGWDLTEFNKNPVMLANHNYREFDAVIGTWENVRVVGGKGLSRKRLEGTARYHLGEGNELAEKGFALARRGVAAFSVGFEPDMEKAVVLEGGNEFSGPFEFNGQTLLETSQVAIGANAEALQRMKNAGIHPFYTSIAAESLPLPSNEWLHVYVNGVGVRADTTSDPPLDDLDGIAKLVLARLEPHFSEIRAAMGSIMGDVTLLRLKAEAASETVPPPTPKEFDVSEEIKKAIVEVFNDH